MPVSLASLASAAAPLSLSAVALVFFIGSFTPGPNNLILLISGSRVGFRRTFPQVLGIVVGVSLLLAAQGVVFSEIFERLPWTHNLLRFIFSAFLLWLAWKIASADPQRQGEQKDFLFPIPFGFTRSLIFQAINPKAWAIVGTIVTNYTSGDPSKVGIESLVIALVVAPVSLLSASLWALFGTVLRDWLADPRRAQVFNRTMAALLVVALGLAYI